MNLIVLRIILWLSPSLEKLLMVLLDRWLRQRCRDSGERDNLDDPACNAADKLLEELESLERAKQKAIRWDD
jgi:hypothetical protein